MLLQDVLGRAARHHPDALALVAEGRAWSFAELATAASALRSRLQALVDPGDRVAVVADNGSAWMASYYAVPGAGAVLTPLNHRLAPAEQAALVAAAGARVLLGQPHHLAPLLEHRGAMPTVEAVVVADEPGWLDDDGAGSPPPGAEPSDPAWLLFTSGTTGTPKGVVLTHANLVTAVLGTALARPVAPDDVFLTPFPLCHVAGYNAVLFHLHARPVVLPARFDPAEVTAAIDRNGVTAISLAPTMLRALLDHLDATGASLPSLRTVGYGASPIAPELLREAATTLGVAFSQGYGMTELAGNAVFLRAEDHRRALAGDDRLLRACGRPSPLVEVRVVDESGRDVAPGADGEIVVRGDQVSPRYWREPEATASAWRDGWFHTGDLGRWDDEGYLYVVDRRKDVVVTGGENVASREVEDVVCEHPTVAAVAVVGVPDPYWGEAVCAVVVPRPGATVVADDIVAHVRSRLAGFKRPRHVVVVDALPLNASGKVVKAEVRRLAAERLDR